MSTGYHTALPFGGPLTSAAMEAPLGQLDAGITSLATAIGGTALAIALTTGSSASGQKVVPLAGTGDTAKFIVGQSVWIGDIAGTFEVGVIFSIQAAVSLTMTTNLVNTYASGKLVSASPSELVDARSGTATLNTRLRSSAGTSGAAFPGSPSTNDVFVRTDRGGSRYRWSGAAWTQVDTPTVTAFWGTPSTNDKCFRSDLGKIGYYDGTRWLNVAPTIVPFQHDETSTDAAASYTATPGWAQAIDLWILSVDFVSMVITTNTGAIFWSLQINKQHAPNVVTLLAGTTTASDTPTSYTRHTVAVNALLGTVDPSLQMLFLKTGAPGSLRCGATLYAREVLV
jgi:hypothetical protein